MKVLVTGKNGQLGYELAQTLPSEVNAVFFDSQQLDITNSNNVDEIFRQENPTIVINAAAYTAVDKAESDSKKAFQVNHIGCENLANACVRHNCKLIHISTDFVFDGRSCVPYSVSEKTNPISVYGKSKLAGEHSIEKILPGDHAIIRTAWVYSTHGSNFVKTMLRLIKEKEQLGVVYDQVGTPTYAKGLAEVIWHLVQQDNKINGKMLHWSDAGITSWYDFAVAIQDNALQLGLIDKSIPITAIPAKAYPTPAARPSYSVLDKFEIEKYLNVSARHWQAQLSDMLTALKQS